MYSVLMVVTLDICVYRDTECADLATQLDIFDDEFVEDEEMLAGEGEIDISNHKNVFRAVYTKVIILKFSNALIFGLSILKSY